MERETLSLPAGAAPGAFEEALGKRIVRGEAMSRHTTFRIGGPAELFIEATSADDLRDIVLLARQHQAPYFILGSGSNILVSDAGIRGLVILNKARNTGFSTRSEIRNPKSKIQRVWAESGVVLPTLARECVDRGLSGLEWAIGIPGTVGGAVIGNAGAHGSDIAQSLVSAAILDSEGNVRDWPAQELGLGYRTSRLKSEVRSRKSEVGSQKSEVGGRKSEIGSRRPEVGNREFDRRPPTADRRPPVVLSAEFELRQGAREECEARVAEIMARRKRTQPVGASAGSMFKNPPGDYAGRLIEAAGLKGSRVGDAEISTAHANFFVNLGEASAADIYSLIELAREKVAARFGVTLELEIELVGEW